MADPNTSLIQPFRRNLAYDPIIIPVGLTPVATPVNLGGGGGVTSFKMANPSLCWVWYRGWLGQASDMPTIKDKGHYIAPGAVDICRTQMPQWIAAVAVDEPGVPATAGNGSFLYPGSRLVMIYGSGS